jgi:hypothetical protein
MSRMNGSVMLLLACFGGALHYIGCQSLFNVVKILVLQEAEPS